MTWLAPVRGQRGMPLLPWSRPWALTSSRGLRRGLFTRSSFCWCSQPCSCRRSCRQLNQYWSTLLAQRSSVRHSCAQQPCSVTATVCRSTSCVPGHPVQALCNSFAPRPCKTGHPSGMNAWTGSWCSFWSNSWCTKSQSGLSRHLF
jgi:hypothetical protein